MIGILTKFVSVRFGSNVKVTTRPIAFLVLMLMAEMFNPKKMIPKLFGKSPVPLQWQKHYKACLKFQQHANTCCLYVTITLEKQKTCRCFHHVNIAKTTYLTALCLHIDVCTWCFCLRHVVKHKDFVTKVCLGQFKASAVI